MTERHDDDTLLDSLAAQARAFPPLPAEEVAILLGEAARAPGGPAEERLVEHHLAAALEGALGHRGHGVDLGDLYQEGTLAVVVAVSEYAARGGVASGLRGYIDKVVAVHLDRAVAEEEAARESEAAFVRAAEQLDVVEVRLRLELGREPTTAELAQLLEWPESQVGLVQTMLRAAREMYDEEIVQYLDDDDGTDEE